MLTMSLVLDHHPLLRMFGEQQYALLRAPPARSSSPWWLVFGYSLCVFVLSDAVQRLGHIFSLARLHVEYNGCDFVGGLRSSSATLIVACIVASLLRLSRRLLSVLVERNVSSDTTQRNGLALVSQRESAKSTTIRDFFDGDRGLHPDSHQAFGKGTRKLGHILLDFFLSIWVLLDRPLDILDVDVICVSVDMHHALRPLGENGSLELEQLNLSF